MAILNCAVNSNKTTGTMTVLMSILQDHRSEQVAIWTVKLDQWNTLHREPSLSS